MVLTDTIAYAPEGVVPLVALDDIGITGGKQFRLQFGVVSEFLQYEVAHDVELRAVPVGAHFYLAAKAFRLTGRQRGELGTFFLVQAFRCLKGVFHRRVHVSVKEHDGRVEIGQERVVPCESFDFVHGFIASFSVFVVLVVVSVDADDTHLYDVLKDLLAVIVCNVVTAPCVAVIIYEDAFLVVIGFINVCE